MLVSSKINNPHPQVILAIKLDSKKKKSLFINLRYNKTVVDTVLVKKNLY